MNLVNGKPNSSISIFDRGFLYGDGVFETILVINKKLTNFNLHIKRLKSGCNALKIKNVDYNKLNKYILKSLTDEKNCVLNINITRGTVKSRGYNINTGTVPANIIITTSKIPSFSKINPTKGINTIFSKNILNDGILSGIKHCNRLEQIIYSKEISKKYPEIILCDKKNNIIEGISSNIFFVKKNIFYTPNIKNCGVEGVMKSYIVSKLKKNNQKVLHKDIKKKNISLYDGAFFCNSVRLIWNILSIDGIKFKPNENIKNLIKIIKNDIYE